MNSCACINPDISNVNEFIKCGIVKIRKARKKHICSECRKEINTNEQYEHFRGLDDDGWFTYKTCKDCLSVVEILFCKKIYGGIWEEIENIIYHYPEEISWYSISQLTEFAREKVCQIIEDSWKRM